MKRLTVISILIILFVLSGFYIYHFFGGFEGLGDGNDYAGLARSIITGNGFSLGHVYPLSLYFNSQIPQSDNIWAPGYPVYMALWFAVFGANDTAAVFANIIAVWLLIFAGYLLGKKLLNERAAIAIAALIGLSQVVLYSAVEGTPEILTGALITFSMIVILENQNIPRLFLSAILFSAAILMRYQIAIVAVLFAILFIGDKKKMLPLWLAFAILGVMPWLVRNMIVLGNPFFTLQQYGEFTKGMGRFDDYYFTYRSFVPMTFWYALLHFPLDMAKKLVAGLIFFGGSFPIRFNYLGIVPFFFALFKIDKINGIQKNVVLFSFVAALLIIIVSSFDGHHDRHLIPLQAFFMVAMMIGFFLLAREFGFLGRKALLILFCALLFLPSRFPFQEHTLSGIAAQTRVNRPVYDRIAEIVEPDDVVISDASDAVWWYADRRSIWAPVRYDDIKTLFKRRDCRYLYLARPSEFLNNLDDDQIADFTANFELMPNLIGNGCLYKLKNDNHSPPDEMNDSNYGP